MTAQTDGALVFGPTHAPAGFINAQVTQFDGSAEPVIRELIQNCLDAADRAGRPAQVRFTIKSAPARSLPGWDCYASAFNKAKTERKGRKASQSPSELTVISRIENMLGSDTVPVLLCSDNGCGIEPERMMSLLTPGNTDKGDGGAGSFGLGHHAAFGASDLRYVLYGSRYSTKNNGPLGEISSGHAILATRQNGSGEILSAEGYWRKHGWDGIPWQDGSEFPHEIPGLLADCLSHGTTGTAVAIAGFNDFHRDDDHPASEVQIARAAAVNFAAAIHSGRLEVVIEGPAAEIAMSSSDDLERVLSEVKDQKQTPKDHITGAQAYSAWRTIKDAAQSEFSPSLSQDGGTKVRWRHVDPSMGEQTQVHIIRKGMWITSRVDRLMKNRFPSSRPFDAVVQLSHGRLEELVRASEGPEHRAVDRARLRKKDRPELNALLDDIAAGLKDRVGSKEDEEEHIPDSFAIIDSGTIRRAEKVRKPRPLPGPKPNDNDPPSPGPNPPNDGPGKRSESKRPRAGTPPKYRHVLKPVADDKLKAVLEYDEDPKDTDIVGIRISCASGADGTCQDPVPDDYLDMKSVKIRHGSEKNPTLTKAPPGGASEIKVPVGKGENRLRIKLSGPMPPAHLLRLDVVRRAKDNGPVA